MQHDENINNYAETSFITIDQAAQFLGLKKDYLYRLTHLKEIPYYKYGRFVRFKLEDLREWKESRIRAVPTRAQMQSQAAAYCMNNPRP